MKTSQDRSKSSKIMDTNKRIQLSLISKTSKFRISLAQSKLYCLNRNCLYIHMIILNGMHDNFLEFVIEAKESRAFRVYSLILLQAFVWQAFVFFSFVWHFYRCPIYNAIQKFINKAKTQDMPYKITKIHWKCHTKCKMSIVLRNIEDGEIQNNLGPYKVSFYMESGPLKKII